MKKEVSIFSTLLSQAKAPKQKEILNDHYQASHPQEASGHSLWTSTYRTLHKLVGSITYTISLRFYIINNLKLVRPKL